MIFLNKTAPRPYSDEELAELELQEHDYTDQEKEELNSGTILYVFQFFKVVFSAIWNEFRSQNM